MPSQKKDGAPPNTFIDTIIRKFDGQNRNFLIANAQVDQQPIIFCNDGFCYLTGFNRAEVMQKSCMCEFLHGEQTSVQAKSALEKALSTYEEKQFDMICYKKTGKRFIASILVAPVKNELNEVVLFILNFEDVTRNARVDRRTNQVHKTFKLRLPQLKKDLTSTTDQSSDLFDELPMNRLPGAAGISADQLDTAAACYNVSFVEARKMNHSDSVTAEPLSHSGSDGMHDEEAAQKLVPETKKGIFLPMQNMRRQVQEKVTQVLSMGADVLPEHKLESSRLHRCTILHNGLVKSVWDWLILLMVMYTAGYTPFMAAFQLSGGQRTARQFELNNPLTYLDLIVDFVFMLDLVINFRTTYVNKNEELVSHPGKLAVHYFKTWFLIDCMSAIPFDLLSFGAQSSETATMLSLLKTVRLLRLVRVLKKLNRYSEHGWAVLILMLTSFFTVAHWMACIWYAIADVERASLPEPKIGWLDMLGNQIAQPYLNASTSGPSVGSKYMTALYFIFTSLSTVGFGNIAPNTNNEKIFSIVIMLIGSLMYASIFGNVSAIIQRLYANTARYQTQLMKVKEFIRFHQIPNPLRQRLEEYFQHAWSYTNGIDMNLVLKGFPDCLQADICLHLNRNLLQNCSAFKGASPGCLRALSMKFHTTHVPPGDTLVHRGDVLAALYFISRGSIEILRDDTVMAILGKDDVFGEYLFAHPSAGKSSCNVRALTYCDLHKIMRTDMLDILYMYPEFAQTFQQNLQITYDLRDEELSKKAQPGSALLEMTGQSTDEVSRHESDEQQPPRVEPEDALPIVESAEESSDIHKETVWLKQTPKQFTGPAAATELSPEFGASVQMRPYRASGGGILEFSPYKAGQDVTPINLDFENTQTGAGLQPSGSISRNRSKGNVERKQQPLPAQAGRADRPSKRYIKGSLVDEKRSSYFAPPPNMSDSYAQSTSSVTLPGMSSCDSRQVSPTRPSLAATVLKTRSSPKEIDHKLIELQNNFCLTNATMYRLENKLNSDMGMILTLLQTTYGVTPNSDLMISSPNRQPIVDLSLQRPSRERQSSRHRQAATRETDLSQHERTQSRSRSPPMVRRRLHGHANAIRPLQEAATAAAVQTRRLLPQDNIEFDSDENFKIL